MSQMPEWVRQARAYFKLIEAVARAFETNCQCESCKLLREWAQTAQSAMPFPGVRSPGRGSGPT